MRTRSKLTITFLLVTAVAALTVFAVPPQEEAQALSPDALQSFERFVAERMAYDRIPGLSVGFVKGNVAWARGFGWADVENQSPAKPDSSYRLASITKTITAVAVLKLVEEGKIDLDAEVQVHVPYFPRKKLPVTVRQLLGHVGGISHYKDDAVEGHIKDVKNTRQALAIFQDFDLVAEPGTRYNYSSYGYNLLGAAIEGASGLPYGEFIKTRIFGPLGMTESRLDNPLEIIPNRVRGYQIVNGELKNSEYVDISSRFAAGGTRSTILDLLKYARGIMKGQILKETTWREMFLPLVLRNGFMTEYGLGWGVRPWNGHFAVSHGGAQPETRTQLLIFPAEGFAVAIACNLEGANLMPYVRRLADLVLDEESGLSAYAPGRVRQSICQAVSYAFDYGMSAYLWAGSPLSKDRDDLRDAFDYFTESVGENGLGREYEKVKKKILAGIHPTSKRALTKVGSYMAWALEEEGGKEALQGYHGRGPIAFFNDYIRLSTAGSSPKRHPRFSGEFGRLMAEWENDWAKTHTEEFRRLVITPGTDFETLIPRLKEEFAGASICPDIGPDLAEAADCFLEKKDAERAISVLKLGREVYPASPLLAASLGYVLVWCGRIEEGQKLYLEARELDPAHPVLRADQFIASLRQLAGVDKKKEAQALGLTAVEINPKEPSLFTALAELSILSGEKGKAAEYLKKALQIDPNFEKAKTRLKSLEK
jgi:CubicO group peptidase (beta-lactamase class C family)/tetratricopeptide (TPR) repeat protein